MASADGNPTWVTVTVKLITAIVLFASIAYLSTNAWAVSQVANEPPQRNVTPHNDTPPPKTTKHASSHTAILVCLSVAMVTAFLGSLSSLWLLFNCNGEIKRNSYKWIITQSILLVIIILVYLVPFSFNEDNEHENVSNFLDKTKEHFHEAVGNTKDLKAHKHEHVVPFMFFGHTLTVLISCIIVGLVVGCGAKDGYMAVY